MECSICLDKIKTNDYFKTKCNHTFHHKCAINWLIENDNCPICRHSLNKKPITKNTNQYRIILNPKIFSELTEKTQYKLVNYILDIVCLNRNQEIIKFNNFIEICVSNKSNFNKNTNCVRIWNINNIYIIDYSWGETVKINSNYNKKNSKKNINRINRNKFKSFRFSKSSRFKSVLR